ncbi:phosphotransferase [Psychromarinibacter sp. C21-152]|uniref:Phosphotransferase n=1 Tax=Psychromarinibacter sediminicola TaxID=3033385 RepID=A0AAE3NVM8_9RHOB|nr:phosphotransferase [Psychromarinibacter sediminicola]MDF0602866.1 phosphotransferase [Psychromarinibacter sediminicola]
MGEDSSDTELADLAEALRGLLPRYGRSEAAELSLLTVSENGTFKVEEAGRDPLILRMHRPGYHTVDEIASELAWIDALRQEGVLDTPAIVSAEDGPRILEVACGAARRHVVAFAFVPGVEPKPGDDLVPGFRTLGAISARLHRHARSWEQPGGFTRKTWNFETIAGDRPHWGAWQDALGLTREGRLVLDRLAAALKARLADWGEGAERFGLIHADLRLANLLVEDGKLTVIDFDDCGFGWFLFDFAAAVSFMEDDPSVPDLQAAWAEGYREVAELSPEAEAMLPTFVMLRRLQLTAWIASHSETPTAAEVGAGFTDGTVALAERYLTGG